MLQRWEVSGNIIEPLVVGLSWKQGAVAALGSTSSKGVSLQEELSWGGGFIKQLAGDIGAGSTKSCPCAGWGERCWTEHAEQEKSWRWAWLACYLREIPAAMLAGWVGMNFLSQVNDQNCLLLDNMRKKHPNSEAGSCGADGEACPTCSACKLGEDWGVIEIRW